MNKNLTALFCPAVIFLTSVGRPALGHTEVTVQEARNMIDSNSPPLVIDVREPSEYCEPGVHIPGAINYPWNTGVLQQRYQELPTNSNILLVCRSGNRSHLAGNFLDAEGFLYVYDMLGGMTAWQWETIECIDSDGDGTNDDLDNCPDDHNPGQTDSDGDGTGNACDPDCPSLDGADPATFIDFAILAQNWLLTGAGLDGDLNLSGTVDADDLRLFGSYWLSTCHE